MNEERKALTRTSTARCLGNNVNNACAYEHDAHDTVDHVEGIATLQDPSEDDEVTSDTYNENKNETNEQNRHEQSEMSDTSTGDCIPDCEEGNCLGSKAIDDHDNYATGAKLSSTADYFCTSCDVLLCMTCQYKYHKDHQLSLISEARKAKEKYINELLNEVNKNTVKCQNEKLQLQNLVDYLNSNVKDLMMRIESRAANLCEQIQKRKRLLLDELRSLKKYYLDQYDNQLEMAELLKKDLP